jgi:RimJ/RimL family protein N-acetyltransferase
MAPSPLHRHWPLFGLRVVTPLIELRYPDDDLSAQVVALAARGIHDPATMPFATPWTDAPPDEFERSSLQFLWRQRAEWTPEHWHAPLAVLVDGEVVGLQGVQADGFGIRRSVETGSWLGRAHQGAGLGKEMRAAVLHLAFAGLGAGTAHTAAWHDNAPSLGVTASIGYEPNGWTTELRRGAADRQLRFVLTRDSWLRRRRDDITIEGLEACLALFGAEDLSA